MWSYLFFLNRFPYLFITDIQDRERLMLSQCRTQFHKEIKKYIYFIISTIWHTGWYVVVYQGMLEIVFYYY